MSFDTNFPVLIVGGSSSVNKDLEEIKELIHPNNLEDVFYICVINDQIFNWTSRVDIFCSLHGEKIEKKWFPYRPKNLNWDFVTYVHRRHKVETDHYNDLFPFNEVKDKWRGSSGLYAVQICLKTIGFKKIVLAGVPMDAQPNYFRQEERWKQFSKYRDGWIKAQKEFDLPKFVRSPSGWTQEILGEPTKSFILGE